MPPNLANLGHPSAIQTPYALGIHPKIQEQFSLILLFDLFMEMHVVNHGKPYAINHPQCHYK